MSEHILAPKSTLDNARDEQTEQLSQFLDLAAHLNRGGQFAYYWTPDVESYVDDLGATITPKRSL